MAFSELEEGEKPPQATAAGLSLLSISCWPLLSCPSCHAHGAASRPPLVCARSIFLIDHAWTCRVEHARQQLQQVPGLLHRMANLMGVEFHGELPSAEAVDLVLEEMWRFNQTYQLSHGVSRQLDLGEAGDGQGRGPSLPWAVRGSPGEPGPGPRSRHPGVSRLLSVGPLIPCGFIVGLLLCFGPPSTGDPCIWGPLSSRDTTLSLTIDLSSVTWLSVS